MRRAHRAEFAELLAAALLGSTQDAGAAPAQAERAHAGRAAGASRARSCAAPAGAGGRNTLTCHACGAATTAAWPADLPAGSFGPRVAATVAYLTGRCGVSKPEAQEIRRVVCHLEVGLGSMTALEQQVSAAVAVPVAAAQT